MEDGAISVDEALGSAPAIQSDLPFLVTHWLTNYDGGGNIEVDEQALERIRSLAGELADAFSSAGAYGTALRNLFGDRNTENTNESANSNIASSTFSTTEAIRGVGTDSSSFLRNATYSDVSRRWPHLPTGHLDAILRSSAAATSALFSSSMNHRAPSSVLDASYESSVDNTAASGNSLSILQPQALLLPIPPPSNNSTSGVTATSASGRTVGEEIHQQTINVNSKANAYSRNRPRLVNIGLGSDTSRLALLAADSSRRLLTVRSKLAEKEKEIRAIQSSLAFQHRMRDNLQVEQKKLESSPTSLSRTMMTTTGTFDTAAKPTLSSSSRDISDIEVLKVVSPIMDSEQIRSKELEIERVVAQLERKLSELLDSHGKLQAELEEAEAKATKSRREAIMVSRAYQDPDSDAVSHVLPVYVPPYSTPDFLEERTTHTRTGRPTLLQSLVSRQYVGGSIGLRHNINLFGMRPTPKVRDNMNKSIITHRMSHALTVNCHLFYPVYCLRFDKTGQYFVTGADDHLVKLFYLGGSCSKERLMSGKPTLRYGGNSRGAVLVCTLRGHAGVITDIDVSADNALLATASEDGDCRIWGLKDGCPVAVLRGHQGGANMVSWSVLTPFRLVSTAQDGLARMWDVREAALKRYMSVVDKRDDYILPMPVSDKKIQDHSSTLAHDLKKTSTTEEEDLQQPSGNDLGQLGASGDQSLQSILPPIPVRQQGSSATAGNNPSIPSVAANENGNVLAVPGIPYRASNNNNNNAVVVPPLPPGAEGRIGIGRDNGPGAPNGGYAGENYVLDEGVRLLDKLQHGDVVNSDNQQQQGPGTRSRRKAVKVICITRCPIGGHFATGSDDGLGRVWADEDDSTLQMLDSRAREKDGIFHNFKTGKSIPSSPSNKKSSGESNLKLQPGGSVVPSKDTLLATLPGHLNAITDIQYSNAGDRILTASEKDGNVRIWSWEKEGKSKSKRTRSGSFDSMSISREGKLINLTQILIRLTPPHDNIQNEGTAQSRRRGASRNSSDVSNGIGVRCDVAVWISDDSKVITSQSSLTKANNPGIVPGSHVIHAWDSGSGRCLLGISSAHELSCPVLVPHPFDPSILASGGADGRLNLWNLNNGKSFFSHKNVHHHGPVENGNNRGKVFGYLDGSFSPDGLTLVLTDDTGRITIIDTLESAEMVKRSSPTSSSITEDYSDSGATPAALWMQEQYFANDYYELYYDAHGYAIDRGSELPPHLAPRAARCNHTGSSFSEEVNQAFYSITGPLPLSQEECRWRRDLILSKAFDIRNENGLLQRNYKGKRGTVIAQSGGNAAYAAICARESIDRSSTGDLPSDNGRQQQRSLSTNYRWSGYDEIVFEEDDESDSDDELYEAPTSRPVDAEDSTDDMLSESDRFPDSNSNSPQETSRRREHSLRSRMRSNNARTSISDRSSPQETSRRRERSLRSRLRSNDARTSFSERPARINRRNRNRAQMEALAERIQHQPTRVSRRQFRQRRTYEEAGSSDEDIIEELSCVTHPTEHTPHMEDYTEKDHFFKMPSGADVHRAWLCRKESRSGLTGKKSYAPQVGDSVVYIPRAHYDTLLRFPTGASSSAPWKDFPEGSAWPVVRCSVKHIRYRFPYQNCFRPRNRNIPQCTSVVAILMLEVTGIPIDSDNGYPWPVPEFVSRQTTRSSRIEFEVSVFENEQAEFLIPENLYLWRVKSLESAIRGDPEGLELNAFYRNEDDDSEENFLPYSCKFVSIGEEVSREYSNPVDGQLLSEIQIYKSGYNSIEVEWNDGSSTKGSINSWEVNVSSVSDEVPDLPTISEAERKTLLKILDNLEEEYAVKKWFVSEVNTARYTDYLQMIEVPMHLSFIRERLNKGYYTNRLSLAADVELIVNNCVKYNDEGDVVEAAYEMLEEFKTMFEENEQLGRRSRHTRNAAQRSEDDVADDVAQSNDVSCVDSVSVAQPADGEARVTRSSARTTRASTSNNQDTRRQSPCATNDQLSTLEGLPNPHAGEERMQERMQEDSDENAGELQVRSSRRKPEVTRPSKATRDSNRAASENRDSLASADTNNSSYTNESGERNEMNDSDEYKQSDDSSEDEVNADDFDSPDDLNEEEYENENETPRQKTIAKKRVTRSSKHESSSDEDFQNANNSESEEEKPCQKITSNMRKRKPTKYNDLSDELNDEFESEDEKPHRNATAKKRVISTSKTTKPSVSRARNDSSTNKHSSAATPTGPSTRSSSTHLSKSLKEATSPGPKTRSNSATKKHYVSSDEYCSDDNVSEESEDIEVTTTRKRKNTMRQNRRKTRTIRKTSKRSKKVQDYSDDENAFLSGSSEEFQPSPPKRNNKRKVTNSSKRNCKKSKESATDDTDFLPDIPLWPSIGKDRIEDLAFFIIHKLVDKDHQKLFTEPVVQQYPELADLYLSKIPYPMDFRTISEERLHSYENIRDLQKDLILVFKNCCMYNGEKTEWWYYAVDMWKQLTDVFREACEEEGIELPRRW